MSVQEMLDLFGALADGKRLRILKLLELGELCLCHIIAATEMNYAAATGHLKVLIRAGLLKERKIGKVSYYTKDFAPVYLIFPVEKLMRDLHDPETTADRERLVFFLRNGRNKCDIYLKANGHQLDSLERSKKRYLTVTSG